MEGRAPLSLGTNFRQFFFRGLGILLPTVLTIWILIAGYQFVQGRIASPINNGIRQGILLATPWPRVDSGDLAAHREEVMSDPARRRAYVESGSTRAWLEGDARRATLSRWWSRYSLGLDLIGLVVAIVLIYMAGLLLGSFIGHRIHRRSEQLVQRLPLIGRVYPSVKQVTDFFVGEKDPKMKFNQVVAVEYPRKGIWSVGLVTGETMRDIQDTAEAECMTIFIPSSPTPFTGYVITVPVADTINLPIAVEDALKFVISGGVLVPPSQLISASLESDSASPSSATPPRTTGRPNEP